MRPLAAVTEVLEFEWECCVDIASKRAQTERSSPCVHILLFNPSFVFLFVSAEQTTCRRLTLKPSAPDAELESLMDHYGETTIKPDAVNLYPRLASGWGQSASLPSTY